MEWLSLTRFENLMSYDLRDKMAQSTRFSLIALFVTHSVLNKKKRQIPL